MVWAGSLFSETNYKYFKDFSNSTFSFIESDSTLRKRKDRKTNKNEAVKPISDPNMVSYTYLRKDVSEAARREQGSSVSTNSYAINDALQLSTLSNIVSFNIYDKGLNVHSFSGTQSSMYALNFTSENNVNTKRDLFGFEYRFKKADSKKFVYSARARLEKDDESRTYYQLGFGVQLKGGKRFTLAGIEHFPVRSGPGHILEIYRTQFASYNKLQIGKRFKQITSFETNYYSDEQMDAIVLARLEYLATTSSFFNISPLLEFGYGLGTINRRDSYPYWMAKDRRLGGAGLTLNLGSEASKFQMVADASIFAEINQANFERYTGNLVYHIKGFTTLNAGFEVYTIENFYSNVFQFGMVYHFE